MKTAVSLPENLFEEAEKLPGGFACRAVNCMPRPSKKIWGADEADDYRAS
jgi:hypothetical protein